MKIWSLLLVLSLFALPASAQETAWWQASSRHFLLFTDTSEAKAERLLSDLESRVSAFDSAFGASHPRQFPIEIFLFKQRDDFIELVPATDMVKGEKNAYLFKGPDRVFIVARDKSPEDIANDAGHALGHVLFEHEVMWRPFWLAEGAAEFVRKWNRAADSKTVKDKDAFSVEDLLTIAPSAEYNDSDPPTPFRLQAYRLLRVLLDQHPEALRKFVQALAGEDGAQAKPDVNEEELSAAYDSYVETPLKAGTATPQVTVQSAVQADLAIQRGDLLMAAGKTSEAGKWYRADSKAARAARAIVTRYTRTAAESLAALNTAASDFPDLGLIQYHFGSIETPVRKTQDAQVVALERAVKLLPEFGRAYAELARVYALTGKADQAMPLLQRAVALEPEFSDHYYDIRVDVAIASRNFDEAYRSIKLADALPHADHKVTESYMIKVMNARKKIENARRDLEASQVAEIRREVESKVAELEPPPKPVPVVRVPEGQIRYEIEARTTIEVVDALYPDYPEALRRQGISGRVVMRVNVAPDGHVLSAAVSTTQVADLTAATIEAVKQWKFKLPPRPGPATITLSLIFSLQ